eukprot:scaffold88691_cov59-Phaeocystis_antarctica.AAC.1
MRRATHKPTRLPTRLPIRLPTRLPTRQAASGAAAPCGSRRHLARAPPQRRKRPTACAPAEGAGVSARRGRRGRRRDGVREGGHRLRAAGAAGAGEMQRAQER